MSRVHRLVLAAFFSLAAALGAVNPLFEAPDEHWHYFTAQFVADRGRLPAVPQPARQAPFVPEIEADWLGQEAAQPPLYYALAALVIAPLETAEARSHTIYNPFVQLGDAGSPVNRNAFVHGPQEQWPWTGHVLAAHLLRLLSAVIGLGTLWLIYDSGRRLWPNHPRRPLLALALVAFLPQFIFLHSAITNDVLIILLTTWVLRELIRLFQERPAGLYWQDYVKLGVLCGLAMLTKNQGIILLGFTGLLLIGKTLAQRRETRDERQETGDFEQPPINLRQRNLPFLSAPHPLLGSLVSGLWAMILAGWLYWRNWSLYGDPTATNQFIVIAGGDRGFSLLDVLGELPGLWQSSFGVFGWFNVRLPNVFYTLWALVVVVAVAGAVDALRQQKWPTTWSAWLNSWPAWLALWMVLVLAGLISFAMRTPAMQGRLLFPAILPLALMLAYGLNRWLAADIKIMRFTGRGLAGAALAVPLVATCVAIFWVVPRAFANQYEIAEQSPRWQLELQFGDLLYLDSAAPTWNIDAADRYYQTDLRWEMLHETDENIIEFVQLVTAEGERWAGVDTFHGGGVYPTSLWTPGEVVNDPIFVRLPPLDPTDPAGCFPEGLGLDVGLYTAAGPLTTANGQTTVRLGTVRRPPYAGEGVDCLAGRPQNEPFDLNGQVRLIGYALSAAQAAPGAAVTLEVVWETVEWRGLTPNYTVFVHLLDENGENAATFDRPPLFGTLPTGRWQPGDIVPDTHLMPLPADLAPGQYTVTIGWYNPLDFARLPVVDAGGIRLPNDAIPVGTIEVNR